MVVVGKIERLTWWWYRYHKGNAVFHDGEKYWSCCPQTKVLDFDQFMKIPGCVVGKNDDGRE